MIEPTPTQRGILLDAIKAKGQDHQVDKCIEEMSELTNALIKKRHNRDNYIHVCEEIADVLVTATQMAMIFGEKAVEANIEEKINRIKERLERNEL